MIVKSFAKINLSLKITGKRENGYHDLEMVNLPVDLHDIIEIDSLPYYNDTYITCDDIRLMSLRMNLCTRAVDAMRAHFKFKQNFMIRIHKVIPFAAGLGGGSSNAAAVMMALNKMLKLNASMEELAEIGKTLGADVPYFLNNKPCLVTGIGEIMNPIPVKKNYHCLIIKPEQGLSTKDVYDICDSFPREDIDTQEVVAGLAEGDEERIAKAMGNDLMAASVSLCEEVGSLVESLKRDGFLLASMSGSGSSVFALTPDAKKAKEALRKYTKLGYSTYLCNVLK